MVVITCKQSNEEYTNQTPTAATNSNSNINNMAQNGNTDPRDTTPSKIANEPPPPPLSRPSTLYPMGTHDILEAKEIAMSLKGFHIRGVKATVADDIVTLTGNASKKDLRLILEIANQHSPKKVINKMTVK